MINLKEKIFILDGAMGTMIQRYGLTEDDYRSGQLLSCDRELKGNNECLNLTHPEIIKSIHKEYIEAGADIIETNTFSANVISQSEYGCGNLAAQMAYEGARIAREAADEAGSEYGRKIWVAGSMGPTSKSLSLSSDVSSPASRAFSFDDMYLAYRQQAEALLKGGADILLIETCFDALNVKAALKAISELSGSFETMISVSVGDRSGRTLTGQTLEAFYTAVKHYPIMSFGLNCSLGAAEMSPLIEDISRWCRYGVSCYPNAGLPNEMGGYDQTPAQMAEQVREMASKGLVNIVGGCCGTTPDHIRAIAEAVRDLKPRQKPVKDERILTVSGLEAVSIDIKNNNFTNVGERTNVAGSRKFARLIAAGEYNEGLRIAARQVEDGASVIDINMDDAMLDSTKEMETFLRHLSNDPDVAKAAIMIDSSHWETLLAGLKNAQGKCIVNSISLKEGEEAFISKAREIKSFGAAMVVMAFDEVGQATSLDRKIEICSRAYRLLTEEAEVAPEDIIFDANILSIGTGIEEHSRYAVDFIEAVRWIKTNLPGALTSGGVSNLSFAFRGNNTVREAMHSAFLYHAIKAGLDMAIVNPSMLQVYDDIEPELLKCVEDVIFNRDPQASERLLAKASSMQETAGHTGIEKTPDQAEAAGKAAETVEIRLRNALVKGHSDNLADDLKEALDAYGKAVDIIEGPLMDGMEAVGKMFAEGKMFLPQVVKSAKVMKDAVDILSPYMEGDKESTSGNGRPKVVLATVKGDVHDIGKNITGIILTCNGFHVHDLGVMVDKETILAEAERIDADIIAVSGLITPSLFQMEELCREMTERGMDTPLMIGGATTSALHTAVKLAPLYKHVFYGPDASAGAVMAKKCMIGREEFEKEEHRKQEEIRRMYMKKEEEFEKQASDAVSHGFAEDSYLETKPEDMICKEIPIDEVMPYFDWKMFYAVWGVKYGSAVPEAAELMQLRRDAEVELEAGEFNILLSARFFDAVREGNDIVFEVPDKGKVVFPMLRQESGKELSLCDFIIGAETGRKSPLGMFGISVNAGEKQHVHGCCCPACSNRYEDLISRIVKQTLAEAASKWLDSRLKEWLAGKQVKIVKPAAGYASCPDHTLKKDILEMTGQGLGIKLTESFAMIPEASICGLIFMHHEASYPEIRTISTEQYETYSSRRQMTEDEARRFLGHLIR